ncbi:uncharacterized protein LOC135810058 [Sycon ciliatum]|uniref:uncharacterized protein LOC135810058 n=1 Tax=Sycon ciliatum TaxID=27933 RepID=UPI0020A93887|eukprot:scpid74727/ scgid8587/ Low density lipoprotein receptor adapter protein 1; Autosomal recessive hypercholesterolemia protein
MAARLLRKTGEAIKHSPGALRRAMKGSNTYSFGEEEAQDPFKVGLSFYVTYLGFEKMESVAVADKETVRKVDGIVSRVIAAKKTTPVKRLVLVVSGQKLSILDRRDAMDVIRIPLYAVAYAGSHPIHNNVFVFLESKDTSSTSCHVMLCESTKMARTLVRVTAKAFQNAFLDWQANQKKDSASQKREERLAAHQNSVESSAQAGGEIPNNMVLARTGEDATTPAEPEPEPEPEENLYEEVSAYVPPEKEEKLARHRSFYRRSSAVINPHVLSTGDLAIKPEEDLNYEEIKEFAQTFDNDTAGE